MAKATSNKSMRVAAPTKVLRRRSVNDGDAENSRQTAGASGKATRGPRRPGRAASLLSTAQNTRSQKWRNPAKGAPDMRRGVLAIGSHTKSRRSPARSAKR